MNRQRPPDKNRSSYGHPPTGYPPISAHGSPAVRAYHSRRTMRALLPLALVSRRGAYTLDVVIKLSKLPARTSHVCLPSRPCTVLTPAYFALPAVDLGPVEASPCDLHADLLRIAALRHLSPKRLYRALQRQTDEGETKSYVVLFYHCEAFPRRRWGEIQQIALMHRHLRSSTNVLFCRTKV